MKGVGADRIQAVYSAPVLHTIQHRILQVDFHFFIVRYLKKIYWTALNRGIRNPFKLRNACCWHQQGHYLFISVSLLLQNCATKILQFGSGASKCPVLFFLPVSRSMSTADANNTKDYRSVFAQQDNISVFWFGEKKKCNKKWYVSANLWKLHSKWNISTFFWRFS